MADRTVSTGLARELTAFAVTMGADRDALLAEAEIGAQVLEAQDDRLDFARYIALMRAAKRLTGEPAFPLHFGMRVDMSEFSIAGLIFQTCRTVVEAIVQINRYGRLIIDVDLGEGERFQWRRAEGGLWLVDTRTDPNAFPELTESTFARFIGMTRRFWEKPLVEAVHVTHAEPAHAADYPRILEAPARFGQAWNAMRVDEPRLTDPIASQPRYAFGILSEHAEALLVRLGATETMRAQVEAQLIPILHSGDANIDRAAADLGVSRQTLYRRLKAEGVTFAELLDALRHRLALDYLRGRRVTVNQTAYLTGFSDPAAFSRAFKRWTGESPRSWQARVRG